MAEAPQHSAVMVRPLLDTQSMTLRDICCDGACMRQSAPEAAEATALVFPYRGAFVHHLGDRTAVAEASQLLFFNAGEEYAISHPVGGGDACLSLALDPALLDECAPRDALQPGEAPRFHDHRLRIGPAVQRALAALRTGLAQGVMDPLEAEAGMVALLRHALGERTAQAPRGSYGRQKLVDRVKLVLAADPARRWTLAEIGAAVRCSPVYLTQCFREVEGVPLYRYQLRLRLARALELLPSCEDLTGLALDLGFSSHSHFTAAFRETFGCTPSTHRAGQAH